MFLYAYVVQVDFKLTHDSMNGARATEPSPTTGRRHTATVVDGNTTGADWSFVARHIPRLCNDTIIPARPEPTIHIIKEIRAIIIIVLNNGNCHNCLLSCCIADGIGINRIGRANILWNILNRTTAKGKRGHNGKYNQG